MVVRKPTSINDKPIKSFDEITPEFLAEKERTWEEVKLKELTLQRLKNLGEDLQKYKKFYEDTEQQCRWRAIRAVNLGYDKKELAEAFGIPTRTITKWVSES